MYKHEHIHVRVMLNMPNSALYNESHLVNSESQHVCPQSDLTEVDLFPVHCSTWQ